MIKIIMNSQEVEFPNPKSTDLIRDYAESTGFKDVKISLKPGSAKGDNYIGIIFKVKIEGKKINKHEVMDVIVKSCPIDEITRELIPIREFLLREIFAYTKLLKTYDELQNSFSIDNIDRYHFPTCYNVSSELLNEFLVLEDLSFKSYRMHEPKSLPLDFEHMKIALTTIAKFHGLSFVLENKHPKLFSEYVKKIPEAFAPLNMPNEPMAKYFKAASQEALEALKDTPEFEIFQKYTRNTYENVAKSLQLGKVSVICHGDYWKNNIFFKYSVNNKPISAIPLDYQILRYSSPLTDIIYLMNVCTSQELRNEKYHELLEIYYDSLRNYLSYYSLNVDEIFTKEQYYEELKRVGSYGLGIAICALMFMTASGDEMTDATIAMKEATVIERDSPSYIIFRDRLYGVLQDCIKYGYLDEYK